MKQICLLLTALTLLTTSQAQKQFDSAAYTNFYKEHWPKFRFEPLTENRELTLEEKITGLSKCQAEAKYNFANFDLVPALNWNSVYQSYIPKVLLCRSNTYN